METIINVDDVSFSYGTQAEQALSHVSLSVNKGDFIGIIGPSGAGKSTLAACLSGAVPHHYTGAFYGSVLVDGHDTCEVSLTDISQIVGSVLQDIDTQMVASVVEDEMLFGLENFGVPHDQIEQRLSETLKTVGISDLRDREIATLSGGQKQKVAIAAILAMRPRVLVLDEPTAALDPASSTLVFETLREANRALGITVVVVEQKVALLSEYCNRVLVLDHGQIALQGEPHEVFARTDELRTIGVDCPRVTRIFNSLETDGLVSGTPCLDVDEAERLMGAIMESIKAIRNMRAEVNVPPGKKVPATMLAAADLKDGIEANADYIHLMGAISELTVLADNAAKPENAMAAVVVGIEVYLPLAGLIDVEKENARLNKELAAIDKELSRVEGKLGNAGFLAKAPEAVIEKEKAKAEELNGKKAAINERLEYLKTL